MNGLTRTLAGAGVAMALFTAIAGAQSTAIPRTPWGDPDMQGTYTNSNESGIPMERPAEFAGRRLEDVKPEELAALVKQRAARAEQTAETIGGTQDENTGAGPKHWYENYNGEEQPRLDDSRIAPDYKMPATTDDAEAARGGGARGAPRRRRLLRRPLRRPGGPDALRALHHARRAGLDDAGDLRQLVRDRAGRPAWSPSATRWCTTRASSRSTAARRSPPAHAVATWATRAATGKATRSWSKGRHYLEPSAFGGASSRLKTIERFRPTSQEHHRVVDHVRRSSTWVKPWTFGMRLTRDDEQPIFEYACHEGNEGLRGILSAARAAEKEQAARPSK